MKENEQFHERTSGEVTFVNLGVLHGKDLTSQAYGAARAT